MANGINSEAQRILVILLVIIFGSGSWLTVSGVWSEIPILVALGLPEKNLITSYITLIVQSGLFGVFIFLCCNRYLASTRIYRLEIPVTYAVTFIGSIGSFLLIFFWNSKTYLSGEPHSVFFLFNVFLVSLVDMMMNTTSMGFISLLKPAYLNWLWFGIGMSSILPACVVLIQQAGATSTETCVANYTFLNQTVVGNASVSYNCTSWREVAPEYLFTPSQYFTFLFVMMLCCHISFICLNYLPCARREYAPQPDGHHLKKDGCGGLFQWNSSDDPSSNEANELLISRPNSLSGLESANSDQSKSCELEGELRNRQLVFLYSMCLLNKYILFGTLSPLQGFSASAYGRGTYGLVMPIHEIADALAFLLFLLKPIYSFKVVTGTFILGFISSLYCVLVAALSPYPPFSSIFFGKVLIVAAWIGAGLFHSYSRAATSWILRHTHESRKHLILSSALGEIGATVGAIVMFILINVCNIFVAYEDQGLCPTHPTCIIL
ncbi:solute carrier family 52, riboflavin transporter, member 3-like [Lytechinus pictus]|uniref:solute carrier family 52, riboflavin transporter, member 3-like n=1 Tax=Lytechinus pictus TaxID=7653 RepID=UPI0030BA115D